MSESEATIRFENNLVRGPIDGALLEGIFSPGASTKHAVQRSRILDTPDPSVHAIHGGFGMGLTKLASLARISGARLGITARGTNGETWQVTLNDDYLPVSRLVDDDRLESGQADQRSRHQADDTFFRLTITFPCPGDSPAVAEQEPAPDKPPA